MPPEIIEQGPRLIGSANDVEVESLRALYENWMRLADGALPHPDTFDPATHFEVSRSWIWLDVLDGGKDFRARFVGPEFDELVGQATTGLKFSELADVIGQAPRDRLLEIANMVYETRQPIVGGPRRTKLAGKEWVVQRSLSLPFSTTGADIDRILLAGHITWSGI